MKLTCPSGEGMAHDLHRDRALPVDDALPVGEEQIHAAARERVHLGHVRPLRTPELALLVPLLSAARTEALEARARAAVYAKLYGQKHMCSSHCDSV